MERAYERSLGTALVAVGVALLLFGFVLAYEDLQALPSGKAPTARFAWSVTGFTATLNDTSSAGGSSLTTVYWTFGDGASNSSPTTTHTYPRAGTYNVTLQIQDSSGGSAESTATLAVSGSGSSSGSSSPSQPIGNGTNLGSVLGPVLGGVSGMVKTLESFVYLVVFWLVGGSILRAGWNLITPKAETISVRVRPRSLQLDPGPAPGPAPAAGPTPPPSAP